MLSAYWKEISNGLPTQASYFKSWPLILYSYEGIIQSVFVFAFTLYNTSRHVKKAPWPKRGKSAAALKTRSLLHAMIGRWVRWALVSTAAAAGLPSVSNRSVITCSELSQWIGSPSRTIARDEQKKYLHLRLKEQGEYVPSTGRKFSSRIRPCVRIISLWKERHVLVSTHRFFSVTDQLWSVCMIDHIQFGKCLTDLFDGSSTLKAESVAKRRRLILEREISIWISYVHATDFLRRTLSRDQYMFIMILYHGTHRCLSQYHMFGFDLLGWLSREMKKNTTEKMNLQTYREQQRGVLLFPTRMCMYLKGTR